MVLVLLNFGKYGPWVKSLEKLQVWSLKFHKLVEMVPRNFKSEKKSTKDLVLFKCGKNGPCECFGKITTSTPQLSAYYNFGPWA